MNVQFIPVRICRNSKVVDFQSHLPDNPGYFGFGFTDFKNETNFLTICGNTFINLRNHISTRDAVVVAVVNPYITHFFFTYVENELASI